jgi:hypothetical protein
MPRGRGGVTRFTVMAMLQAARAQSLGLKRESAYSWGLNRAIFYAAAKRGFRTASSSSEAAPKEKEERATAPEMYRLGDDEAYRDPEADDLLFTIGEKTQTAAEFERQIASRFGSSENFRAAWEEARSIIAQYDRATLESRREFFDRVYKPRRDELSAAWTERFAKSATHDAPA